MWWSYFWDNHYPKYFFCKILFAHDLQRLYVCIPKVSSLSYFFEKMPVDLSLLHLVVVISPFVKWGIYFMECFPTSIVGHNYIILAIDYFKKWVEEIPTYSNDAKIAMFFMFNHIIAWFCVPKIIMTDHGSHFCNKMMSKLASFIWFGQEHYSPYYPQDNG